MKRTRVIFSSLVVLLTAVTSHTYAQALPTTTQKNAQPGSIGYGGNTNPGETGYGGSPPTQAPIPSPTPDCIQQYLQDSASGPASDKQKERLRQCLDTTMCGVVEALAQTLFGSATGTSALEPHRQTCNTIVSMVCPPTCKNRWMSLFTTAPSTPRTTASKPCSIECSLSFFVCDEGLDIFDELRKQCKAGDQGFEELWKLLGLHL